MGELPNLNSWVPVPGISKLGRTLQVTEVSKSAMESKDKALVK